jgi:hypothetical protein
VSVPERQVTKREIVETELRKIWDERAQLLAGDVLDAARPEDSALHGFFLWDDDEAAERYRLVQAAMLIRSVKLRVTSIDARGRVSDYTVRAWVPSRYLDGDIGSYQPVETVQEDPKTKEALLRQMLRDAQAFQRRYRHLAEYSEVVVGLLNESDAGQ